MAISIGGQWVTTTSNRDARVGTAPTPGNWLFAVVTWRTIDGTEPAVHVGDVARNMWTLLSTSTQVAYAANSSQRIWVQVWAAPAVRYEGWPNLIVNVAPLPITASDTGSLAVNVFEVSGLTGFTVDSVTVGTATNSTGLTINAPAPAGGGNVVMVAAAGTTDNSKTVSVTSPGWGALNGHARNGPDVRLTPMWRTSTAAQTASWSASGPVDWAGVVVAIRETGATTPRPNPNWPATKLEIGFGYSMGTPLSAVRWTDVTERFLQLSTRRGIQYELGTAQSEGSDLTLANDDGAFTPRPEWLTSPWTTTVSASGTASTVKIPAAAAVELREGHCFRIGRTAHLTSNIDFNTGDTTGWNGMGGTLTCSTEFGSPCGKIVPDGVTEFVQIGSVTQQPILPGARLRAAGWVFCAAARWVSLNIHWYNGSHGYMTGTGNGVSVTANTWTYIAVEGVAPAGAAFCTAGTVMGATPPPADVLWVDKIELRVVEPADPVFKITDIATAGGTSTVTFTPAASTDTNGGDTLTGVPVDVYVPFRVTATWNGTTYPVATGWVERWPQSWNNLRYGLATAVGIDAFATLTAANPGTVLRGEILRRHPQSYWPLDDPQGATGAQNISGRSTAQLIQTQSKYGRGLNTTADFGESTQGVQGPPGAGTTSLLGDPGSCWFQDGLTAAEMPSRGFALVGKDDGFPPLETGVTVFGVSMMTATAGNIIGNGTVNPTIFIIRNADARTSTLLKLSVVRNGNDFFRAQITTWDKDTRAWAQTVHGPYQVINGGNWRTWAVSFTRTSYQVYVSGTPVGGGVCDLPARFTSIEVGGEASAFWNGNSFSGRHAHIAVFDRQLTAGELLALDDAARGGWFGGWYLGQGETSGQRITRKLDTVGWRGGRVVDHSDVLASVEGAEAASVVDLVNEIAGYEDGWLFVDAAGQLQFSSRLQNYQRTPRAVLGDRADLGEIGYTDGVSFDFDTTFVYNQVQVENQTLTSFSNVTSASTIAEDPGSQARYGSRVLTRSARVKDAGDAFGLAHELLARYATPRLRVGTVTVNAAANPAAWPFVLGVEIGDVVRVNRRPLRAAPISTLCRVLQVAHDVSPGKWSTTLTLAAAPPQVAQLGDGVAGVVGDVTIGW